MEKNDEFYAGGFFYNSKTNSVLLHLRDDKALVNPNQWGFFGGRSEAEENPVQCFVRELKEELDIDLTENEIVPLCDYFNEKRGIWRYVFYVRSEIDKSQVKLGEGADLDWISLDKVFEYDLTGKTRRDIKFFINQI